jgi:hypothetical protein
VDPLTTPLINVTHSIAYAFSPSTVDPFSNLLKVLHQKSDRDNTLFLHLTQTLGARAIAADLLDPLYSIIQREGDQELVVRHLAIQSLTVLSINNGEFASAVLSNIPFFVSVSAVDGDEFLENVLQLFEVVAEYAIPDQAREIIASVEARGLLRYQPPQSKTAGVPVRDLCLSILKSLARFGDAFPQGIVEEIARRCNQPKPGVMWPAVLAVSEFLRQPESQAYRVLVKKSDELVARLGLAVIACEKMDRAELKVLVMKVFLEVCDEFRVDDLQVSLNEIHVNLTAVLVSMGYFAEEPVKRMAGNVLHRFNIGGGMGTGGRLGSERTKD